MVLTLTSLPPTEGNLRGTSPNPARFAVLRILDVCIALPVLVASLPILLVCLIVVRTNSTGPGIFRQKRVGKGHRIFICYKLRTMKLETRSVASHEVSISAITTVGGFLRRTKLDELPQLVNVMRGEMSLVGPRPCLPTQAELIAAREERGVYGVRPGITGPAQIKGVDMSTPQVLAALDAKWLSDGTVRSYLACVIQTALGGGHGDRVRFGTRSTEKVP